MPNVALPQATLDQLFLAARTHNAWQDRVVPDELLPDFYQLQDLAELPRRVLPGLFPDAHELYDLEELDGAFKLCSYRRWRPHLQGWITNPDQLHNLGELCGVELQAFCLVQ